MPIVNTEADTRPRPPVRESSLHPAAIFPNNGTAGKYSLPIITKVSSLDTTPTSTLTTNQLMVDYDSLLSHLTLKYGSPGERESCLRWDHISLLKAWKRKMFVYLQMVSRHTVSVCLSEWYLSKMVSRQHHSTVRHTRCCPFVSSTRSLILFRSRAEDLLAKQPIGCFLVRLSESRFGFSLSFRWEDERRRGGRLNGEFSCRAEDRCRHYMINQLKNSKYNVIGESKVHKSLDALIEYYRTVSIDLC